MSLCYESLLNNGAFAVMSSLKESLMHQSIPSTNIPTGNPWGFAPIFSLGSRDLYHLSCPGVAWGSDLLSKYQVVS